MAPATFTFADSFAPVLVFPFDLESALERIEISGALADLPNEILASERSSTATPRGASGCSSMEQSSSDKTSGEPWPYNLKIGIGMSASIFGDVSSEELACGVVHTERTLGELWPNVDKSNQMRGTALSLSLKPLDCDNGLSL